MTKKTKSAKKPAPRSAKTKPVGHGSSKSTTAAAKTTKLAATTQVRLAQKRAANSAKARTGSYELGKTVGACLSSLKGWRRECVAQVRRMVIAGHSYLRSNSRKRSTGRISLRKSPKIT